MRKKISGVYTIYCKLTNEYYVGCSTHVFGRLSTHKSHLTKGVHTNPKIQNIFNKYGISVFDFNILEQYDKEILTSMEHYWVTMLNSRKIGFNCRPTNPYEEIKSGRIFNKRIHTQETRKKISEKLKGTKNEKHSHFMKGNSNRSKRIVAPNGITYSSITNAAKSYNVSRSKMRKIIKENSIP
jgi:hypothetical protein